jgi:hypothetical protein
MLGCQDLDPKPTTINLTKIKNSSATSGRDPITHHHPSPAIHRRSTPRPNFFDNILAGGILAGGIFVTTGRVVLAPRKFGWESV